MTKTLTEQWREGTLRGCFYWKLPNGNICTAYTDTMRDIKNVRDSDEVEVLQETLSYVEYKRLQEQLNEANKALKEVCMHCETEQFECRCGWVEPCKDCNAHYAARDYLKKWGVK